MLTYGGIALIEPDAAMQAMIDEHIAIADIPHFQQPSWSGLGGRNADFNRNQTVELGRLYWPRGASRWAMGHFLVAQSQLETIRGIAKSSPSSTDPYVPLTFRMWSTDTDGIETALYMLISRPMFRFGENEVWCMTLVDERYFWWQNSASATIDEGTTTWTDLLDDIATSLTGATFDLDTIEADYLKPPSVLQTERGDYLPPLLDAIAYSVGKQIVRGLDGTVTLQAPASAFTNRDTLLADFETFTKRGGSFALGLDGELLVDTEIWALVPENATTFYRQIDINKSDKEDCCGCGTTTYSFDGPSVVTDNLPGCDAVYQMVGQKIGSKNVYTTAVEWMDNGSSQNSAEMSALTIQWAADWFLWRVGDSHRLLTGIHAWENDGFADSVEWQAYGTPTTRVIRGPLNDVANRVYHYTENTYGSGSCTSCQQWEWTDIKTADYTAAVGEAIPVQPGSSPTITLPVWADSPLNGCVLISVIFDNTAGVVVQVAPDGTDKINGFSSAWSLVDSGEDVTANGSWGGYWQFVRSNDVDVGWSCSRFLSTGGGCAVGDAYGSIADVSCGLVVDECGKVVGGYNSSGTWFSPFGKSDPSWAWQNNP